MRVARFGFIVLLLVLVGPLAAGADTDRPTAQEAQRLSLEIDALQTLGLFDPSPVQLKALAKLAEKTAGQVKTPRSARISKPFFETLKALRAALVQGDEKQANELSDRLDTLREKEKIRFDDKVTLTEAARQRAPDALRLLSPRQVMDYLSTQYEDDLPDPLERIAETLRSGLKDTASSWPKQRDQTAADVAGWIAGFDAARGRQVQEQVVALLERGHGWTKAELEMNQGVLEEAVKTILGETGPLDILRNVLQQDLAELLANPQLGKAIEGLLQEARK